MRRGISPPSMTDVGGDGLSEIEVDINQRNRRTLRSEAATDGLADSLCTTCHEGNTIKCAGHHRPRHTEYHEVAPPSTLITAPVTNELAGDARNNAAEAISSAVPLRSRRISLSCAAPRPSSEANNSSPFSVAVGPGTRQLARILSARGRPPGHG